jgi:hypothetical protein
LVPKVALAVEEQHEVADQDGKRAVDKAQVQRDDAAEHRLGQNHWESKPYGCYRP